ncbi:MAG: serine hydrolase domain-containing protein, partial [Candidatus Sulfotelmatobacter sp.]
MNSSFSAISSPSPLPALDHQDQVFSQAFSILDAAISARAFPAASIAVTDKDRLIALKVFGGSTYPPSLHRSGAPSFSRSLREGGDFLLTPTTLFDLASLTKVVATTTMAMILYQRGLLDLEAPVAAIVPEFTFDPEKDPRRREVNVRMLLAHSSGLPAYEKLYLKFQTRDELLAAAFTTPLTADPGKRAEYSD